jgi:hypothetical protein
MTSFGLGVYSNCFVTPREDPSLTLGSFSFGALGDRLVVGFLGGIVPEKLAKPSYFILTGSLQLSNYSSCFFGCSEFPCKQNDFVYNGSREFKLGNNLPSRIIHSIQGMSEI